VDRSEKTILFGCIGLVGFGLCVAIACGVTFALSGMASKVSSEITTSTIIPEETLKTEVSPTPYSTQAAHQFNELPEDTLDALANTVIPEANWIDLAKEFYNIQNIPLSLNTAPITYHKGDTLDFWVLNSDTNINKKINATLQYTTGNIYFWVQDGIEFDMNELKEDAETFANQIYPTDQEFFGKEWIPGVDNDPHLYILYTGGMGKNIAGYTSDSDSYLKQVQPYSNQHEMFYINSDVQKLSDPYTLSVMAHEFQHLIHGYHDQNEELWLNEGFSELAVFLNGYNAGGFDSLFADDPDINLTEWPSDSDATDAHYGASFLYTAYLLDRYGANTTKAVVADQINGLNSIDDVFLQEKIVDPLTKKQMTSDEFFRDWTLANFINNTSVSDGRYGYHNYPDVPDFSLSQEYQSCGSGIHNGTVSQYGTDYIHISCDGPYQVTFSGDSAVNILTEYPQQGTHYLWSNMVDSSATQISREFDLSSLSGKVTLSYDIWYDIEQDYDFAYLLASTDGESWQILDTPSCSTSNITGNNFGCGYNGTSDKWLHEEVDLSKFAGKKVMLRFEYVTDAGVTGEGLVIDDIAIPQIDYKTSFETDDGGWKLEGFTRIENQVPQTYLVSVIHGSGKMIKIDKYTVSPEQPLTFLVNPANNESGITLVISGTTRYTRQKANYQINVTQH
jgi:immune inhibitor A